MLVDKAINTHYTHGSLLDSIQAALAKLGKSINQVTIDDLAPADEFHIGGREATKRLLQLLNPAESDHVLDVGCGLGGAARLTSTLYSCRVSGIDLTVEYIETGKVLCDWVGLTNQVDLQHGSALAIPFADETFDTGYMLHVGMNIEAKPVLFSEISRVLRPGAKFAVYDVMKSGDGDISYPVPWAGDARLSYLATPDQYRKAIEKAGLAVSTENNRADFAIDFFARLHARLEAEGGPPALSLHTLMGESTSVKVKNMIDNIVAGSIAPIEMIIRKE